MYRIRGYELQKKSHTICRLAIHLPSQQNEVFREGEEGDAVSRATERFTTLTAFFRLNQSFTVQPSTSAEILDPRELLYHQLPEFYVFNGQTGWKERKKDSGNVIGRM